MKAILALDGGATRTRCAIFDNAGRVLGEAESGPSNHLQQDGQSIENRIAAAVEDALYKAQVSRNDIVCVSAGLAGVDYDGYGAEPMEALFRRLGFTNCLVHGDMVIAHAAALGVQPGIVAIAGTGSVVLGIDGNGRRARVGGWGPLYGDEGSGQYIAAAGLRAAARACDGRGPSTALVDAFTKALGLSDFRQTISRLYGPDAGNIASLCPVAHETAVAGDPVALSLFDDAAKEIAEGITTAARLLCLSDSATLISYQGGVAEHCPLLVERLQEQLHHQLPKAQVVRPRWRPIAGAYLLACAALQWEGRVS
jgi:N-acetylglucosamine kinase-like BadF-type ATPase